MSIRKNILWHLTGTLASKALEPLFSILIARLLVPADYGAYALAIAIKAFVDVFKDLGLQAAVIVDRDSDNTSTLFLVQFLIAAFASAMLIYGRETISMYLDQPILAEIIPWTCAVLLLGAIEEPLANRYMRENHYKPLFLRQIFPAGIGGGASLIFAQAGYGVFSLVWGGVIGRMTSAIYLMLFSPRLSIKLPQWTRLRKLLKLGKHITVQKLSGYFVLQADALIVGKFLGTHDAGTYKMAITLTNLLPNAVLGQLIQVVFSESAAHQNNRGYLTKRYHQLLIYSFLCVLIYFFLIFLFSPILIPIILGPQWKEIIPLVQMIGVSIISSSLVNHNNDFSKIIGFNYIYSYFSIIRGILTILCLIVGAFISLHALVAIGVGIGLIANFINFRIFQSYQNQIVITNNVYFLFGIVWLIYALMVASWIESGFL